MIINHSIIPKSQLEGANRLDAEYYQPEYLEVKNYLATKPHWILGKRAFVTDGEHGSVDFVDEGIKYLVGESVGEGFLNLEKIRFVTEEVDKRNRRATLENLDVVLSIKGTIGLSAIVFEEDLPANMNRDVSRIHVENAINPFYLMAFLNSKYGRSQTLRESSGNVQQMITLSRLKELLVPKVSDLVANEVEQIVRSSREELKKSKLLYKEAENLLLKELGLKNFEIPEYLAWEVDYSEVKEAERTDSNYFWPKYESILRKISRNGVLTLSSQFQIIKSGNFKYTEHGQVGVLKTKQLGQRFVNFEVESKTDRDTLEKKELPAIKNRDVLFASMGVGSLGKTNVLYDFEVDVNNKFTIDSTLRILRQKKNSNINPETLAVFLGSLIGQELIYKFIVGTSGIISIYQKYLENFSIPKVGKEVQGKIADLVRRSHQARKKSKELLEQVKRKVEETIKKGGEENGKR